MQVKYLVGRDVLKLEENINEHINAGWVLRGATLVVLRTRFRGGGKTFYNHEYIQQMIRTPHPENE